MSRKHKEFLILSLIGFVFLALWDQTVAIWVSQNRPSWFREFCGFTTKLAELDKVLILFFVMWLYLRRTWERSKLKNLVKWTLLSLLISGAIVTALKLIIGRMRPIHEMGYPHLVFHPLNNDPSFHSLPSGHTQVAIGFFFFIGMVFPKWTWPLFLWGIFLSLTRVVVGAHFVSDIFIGGAIALYVSRSCFEFYQASCPKHSPIDRETLY